MTQPKKPRRPLVVTQRVSGWLPGKYARWPRATVPYEQWIFDHLMRVARQACSEIEAVRAEGELGLHAAAVVIARGESDHFYRIVTARRPRAKKGARAELLDAMRRFRKRSPDPSLKAFIKRAEGERWLIVRPAEGGAEYTFNLESGEYVLRSLSKVWAEAGRTE